MSAANLFNNVKSLIQPVAGVAVQAAGALQQRYQPAVDAVKAGETEQGVAIAETLAKEDLAKAQVLAQAFTQGTKAGLENRFGPASTWLNKLRAAASGVLAAAHEGAAEAAMTVALKGEKDLEGALSEANVSEPIAFSPLNTKKGIQRDSITGARVLSSLEEAVAEGIHAEDLIGVDFTTQSVIILSTGQQFPSSAYAIQVDDVSQVGNEILVRASVHPTGGIGLTAFMPPRPAAIVIAKSDSDTPVSVIWDNSPESMFP